MKNLLLALESRTNVRKNRVELWVQVDPIIRTAVRLK